MKRMPATWSIMAGSIAPLNTVPPAMSTMPGTSVKLPAASRHCTVSVAFAGIWVSVIAVALKCSYQSVTPVRLAGSSMMTSVAFSVVCG